MVAGAGFGVEWMNVVPDSRVGGRMASCGYLKGKVVLLDVRDYSENAESALMKQIQDVWVAYKSKQFVALGSHIGPSGTKEAAGNLIRSLHLTYSIYSDVAVKNDEGALEDLQRGVYVFDSTGKRLYFGKDPRQAMGIVGSAIFAESIPSSTAGWKAVLDYEIANLPGQAYLRIRDLKNHKDVLKKLGVVIKPNCHIGSNLLIDDMFIDGYDAIFLAVGTAKPNRLGLLGETLGNVHFAIDYLKAPEAHELGKTVVVIGVGNVAMDVARTALRQEGVERVIALNNRRVEDVTATKLEFSEALEEGVEFIHQISVLRITENGVIAVDVDVTEDENGNIVYEENMLSRHDIEADSVILAIGQGPVSTLSDKAQIETTLRGLFAVDEKGMTNIPGVFAAGDVVSGPKTVVEAVAHTKRVSEHLIKYCYEKNNK